MKSKLLPSIVLGSICLIVALLLAAVNSVTAPKIEEMQSQKVQETLSKVLPDGVNFVEISDIQSLPECISAAFSEDNGGYVFQMEVTGYKSGLVVMCGINADGKITGADFVQSGETLSAEVGLGSQYVGQDSDSYEPILVSSATKTTQAYADAIKAALDAFAILTEKEGV